MKEPRVLDMVEGRNAGDLGAWLAAHTPAWREAVKVATCDLHELFRAAFESTFPTPPRWVDPMLLLLSSRGMGGVQAM